MYGINDEEIDTIPPETRIVAVSSLLLDQAWPELGVEGGRRRRSESFNALVNVVRRAREAKADVLAILGDLFDQRCVTPKTIRSIGDAFGAFSGPVLVVPGTADWLGRDSPYATELWPASTHIFESAELRPFELPSGLTFWAAAQVSLTPPVSRFDSPARENGDQGPHVALMQTIDPADFPPLRSHYPPAGSLAAAGFCHLIARANPGPEAPDVSATGVATQAAIGRAEPSRAVLVVLDAQGGLVSRDTFELGVSPLEPKTLDAGRWAASGARTGQETALPLRLTGTLPRGTLLPTTDDNDPDWSRLDTRSLDYELCPPDSNDQTAAAEFERLILQGEGSGEERHQAIALGLRALNVGRLGGADA